MRLFRSAWLAAASALIATASSDGARPRYGGVLRVETAAVLRSFDPARSPVDAADEAGRRLLYPLIFETLVSVDGTGGLTPQLALGWTSNAERTEWRFDLRSGVRLHDSSALDAGRVAAVLRAADPELRVTAGLGFVTIGLNAPAPDFPWSLASGKYSIAFGRSEGGNPLGTGPFAIDRWEPRKLTLRAHEEHWAGRPFLDGIEIDMGRAAHDQLTSLELGRVDLIALEAVNAPQATQRGWRVAATRPLELLALIFRADRDRHERARRALSETIDRRSICDVLLQGHGVPASTILPQWLGGYASLVPIAYDPAAARALAAGASATGRVVVMDADDADPVVRSIAARIVVEAADAGITIRRATGRRAAADAWLRRIRLEPTSAAVAFARAADGLDRGASVPRPMPIGASLQDVYAADRARVEGGLVVPLVHVPELYAAGADVESWRGPLVMPSGRWNLATLWLRRAQR